MILDKLWRSQWRRRRYIRKTNRDIKKLRDQQKSKDANELEREFNFELELWHGHIQALRTDQLVRKADRLGIPLPSDQEDKKVWRHTQDDYHPYLTQKAQTELRKELRQEEKERREAITAIIKDVIGPISALIISILSLLIAYAALKLKLR